MAWIAFALSTLLFVVYEIWVIWVGRRHPERMARYAHARMRVTWVTVLNAQPGFEIVAVQALRNSLMSATIAASTAALALMGTITVAGSAVAEGIAQMRSMREIPLRPFLEALLLLALFGSYVCSAMAMRFFNHASLVMSLPVATPERKSLNLMAQEYVLRAGLLYSWGLRAFLMIAPLVAGIVNPLVMPVMTVLLVIVLWWFDRPAPVIAASSGGDSPIQRAS
jgi:uncharacterized membrane protein